MIQQIFSVSLLLIILSVPSYSQRILFQSDFENVALNADSLPQGWKKLDADSNFLDGERAGQSATRIRYLAAILL
ncbi:MAG: hypothetical protein IPG02_19275 [Ignavibacteria bacterium]|nr:hypothetical protein [Ignavibacteria bacterium]